MKTKISKEIRASIRKAAKYRHKASHFEIIIENGWIQMGSEIMTVLEIHT